VLDRAQAHRATHLNIEFALKRSRDKATFELAQNQLIAPG